MTNGEWNKLNERLDLIDAKLDKIRLTLEPKYLTYPEATEGKKELGNAARIAESIRHYRTAHGVMGTLATSDGVWSMEGSDKYCRIRLDSTPVSEVYPMRVVDTIHLGWRAIVGGPPGNMTIGPDYFRPLTSEREINGNFNQCSPAAILDRIEDGDIRAAVKTWMVLCGFQDEELACLRDMKDEE